MARRISRHRRNGARVAFAGVSICEDSQLGPNSFVAHDASLLNSNLGRWSEIGRYSKLNNADVGSFCSISWDVTVGATSHPIDWASTHAFAYHPSEGIVDDLAFESPRTSLGHDVWVGANAVILPGVTVGTGSIIGAGAVVTSDVGPYEIVVGNPARTVRKRIPDELAHDLAESRWWELPDEELAANVMLFSRPLDGETAAAIVSLRG